MHGMIIALSTDSEIVVGSRYLADLYHERILRGVEFFNTSRDSSDLVAEQRLTFLSHSKTIMDSEGKLEVQYAGLSAQEFVKRFTAVMTPEQASHITHIDLIGCNIGYIDKEGHGFVIDVARQLQDLGYHLTINTFMSPHNDYDSLSVNCCPINQNGLKANIWRLLGLKTTEDSKTADALNKKLRIIAKKKHNLSEELKQLQQTPAPAVQPQSKHFAQLLVMAGPQHNPLFAKERKSQILAEIQDLEKLAMTTAIQLQAIYEVLCLTDNPRLLFNTSPALYDANYRLTSEARGRVAHEVNTAEPDDTDSEGFHES